MKRAFTLLEVLVALGLILIASGLTGWKMHRAIAKKRFQSDLACLESRLVVCHQLAAAMQSDWKGILVKKGKEWTFETVSIDAPNVKKLRPLQLHAFDLFFNGKKIQEFEVDFFSSGQVAPVGHLVFSQDGEKVEWPLEDVFQRESSELKKKGPLPPRADN